MTRLPRATGRLARRAVCVAAERDQAHRAQGSGNSKIASIQAEIDSTKVVMQENIERMRERGENLDSLQDKTGPSRCRSRQSAQALRREPQRVRAGLPTGRESRAECVERCGGRPDPRQRTCGGRT